MMMKAHGISQNQSISSDLLSDMLKQESTPSIHVNLVKLEPTMNSQSTLATVNTDDLMEDTSPIAGDPMFSSSSPVIQHHHLSSTGSMCMDEATDMLE